MDAKGQPKTVQEEAPPPEDQGAGVVRGAPCRCAENGISGNVDTGREGCKEHVEGWGTMCYVAEPAQCALSLPSNVFPGARYRNCTLEEEVEEMAQVDSSELQDEVVKLQIETNACACTENGESGGVETGRIGCKKHLQDKDRFCYVKNPRNCDLSQESVEFPGAGWRSCTILQDVIVSSKQPIFQPITDRETGQQAFAVIFENTDS
eukprot:TRINITY_DN7092_c0_g1_i4.p4 TRINITY_DN7092_c0_g1~~TRINITY_DN7092_c0_g1_i4.p4  ORF type:complete len:222 (-),score=31.54 TRINITY_DN7092_c0_g1_i4:963-1583(-)